jgi:hypothetical protein
MGFSSANQGEIDTNESERISRDRRVAFQQFLNQNTAIFTAMARRGIALRDDRFYEIGARLAETARDIAVEVVALVEDVPPGSVSEEAVRVVRPDIVEYVVERWQSGEHFDVAQEARSIAAVLRLADKRFDFNPYGRGAEASPAVSVALSFVAASTLMSCQTLPYDFRTADPVGLPGRLLDAVVDAAEENLPKMIVESSSEAETRTVLQSLMKHFSKLMKAIYDRETEAMVLRVANMDEEARRRWFETHDPIGGLVDDFRDRAKNIVAIAVAKLGEPKRAPGRGRPEAA